MSVYRPGPEEILRRCEEIKMTDTSDPRAACSGCGDDAAVIDNEFGLCSECVRDWDGVERAGATAGSGAQDSGPASELISLLDRMPR